MQELYEVIKQKKLPNKKTIKMSNVPKEAIEVVAQSIGISNLSPDVALALTPDVEYRVREIMQVFAWLMRLQKAFS